MYAFQICGYSKSGKTTLIKELISRFKSEGKKIASVKDIHFEDFQIDEPGKNSFIHKQAGANPVVARGLKETDFLYNYQMGFLEIIDKISADWLMVEGFNDFPLPKIVCGKTEEEIDNFLDRRTFAISGIIANTHQTYKGLPVFNSTDPGQLNKLIELIKDLVGK